MRTTSAPLPRIVRLGATGADVDAHARALHRYLGTGRLGRHASRPKRVRRTFGVGKRRLAKRAAWLAGLPAHGVIGPALYAELRERGAYDALAGELLREHAAVPVYPQLGPLTASGKSLLDHDLTHATGGLPGFPALDTGWYAGCPLLAPEVIEVTGHGRARRRDGKPNGLSVHATGASGIRYWFGHVARPAKVGAKLPLGAVVAYVSANHEEPHGHVGVDARAIIGRELEHRTDYRHGAPTIREQFQAALA